MTTTEYWRYYGLQYDPFAVCSNEKEAWLPAAWEQYLDLLHYFCRSSNVLLTVTGVAGSGKSTFLKQFVRQLSASADSVQWTGFEMLDAAYLCAALAKDFALPPVIGETLEEKLDAHVTNLQYQSRLCLLMIDDAHLLPPETLRALLYLIKQQSENQMRLHILLVGEVELKEKLAALTQEDKEESLCYHLSFEPFSAEEARDYLKYRLTAAGVPAALPLTERAIERIHRLAKGIPAQMNERAKETLSANMRKGLNFSWVDFIYFRQPLLIMVSSGLFLVFIIIMFALTKTNKNISSHSKMKQNPVGWVELAKPNSNQFVAAVKQSGAEEQKLGNSLITPRSTEATITVVPASVKHSEAEEQKPSDSSVTLRATEATITATKPVKIAVVKSVKMVKIQQAAKIISGKYTIQLMSVSSEEAASKFKAEHPMKGKNTYIYINDVVKNQHILLYGLYATSEQAHAALRGLPPELQKLQPWIKILS